MKIAVTGGKGGTGKSTVSTALAVELARDSKVLLLDLDVDCPDDHLLLEIKRKRVKDIHQTIPKWNMKKCIKCGKCAKVCMASAIVFVKGKHPIFVPEQCIGCNACRIVCPTGAIGKDRQKIGTIWKGSKHGVDLITGQIEINYEEASPIINATKEFASGLEKKYDHIVVDTAAGAHCNVISALIGVEQALAVTEPTPLGQHDLGLILDLLKVLKIPGKIVLNRSDIGDASLIKKMADRWGVGILASIPYSKKVIMDYAAGKPVKEENISKIAGWIRK